MGASYSLRPKYKQSAAPWDSGGSKAPPAQEIAYAPRMASSKSERRFTALEQRFTTFEQRLAAVETILDEAMKSDDDVVTPAPIDSTSTDDAMGSEPLSETPDDATGSEPLVDDVVGSEPLSETPGDTINDGA